jgi:hypothetical protein
MKASDFQEPTLRLPLEGEEAFGHIIWNLSIHFAFTNNRAGRWGLASIASLKPSQMAGGRSNVQSALQRPKGTSLNLSREPIS